MFSALNGTQIFWADIKDLPSKQPQMQHEKLLPRDRYFPQSTSILQEVVVTSV
tara:strand:+ start:244 stop:402 length:159 start_codon:yes stop_codon:yes gene_type:complete